MKQTIQQIDTITFNFYGIIGKQWEHREGKFLLMSSVVASCNMTEATKNVKLFYSELT